ncbi:DUF4476 domain-containing protein [Hymenobacter sediminis]|uniref:DUF4476 domain-containing protein n=1 Tax=Hymenobacter sediminis TaxID=2218621 RepID=UPI000DA6D955|nr:DUF4476 domain-containing protein [Hymenobacter sediminis]RPD49225.1 DUF4476 domain-containing protein [Hymenobacter sediminis]
MKKALLLCVGLYLFLASLANAAPANVNFTSERGVVFRLIFDGRALTQAGARQISLSRIAPGFHQAEFLIPTGYGRSISYRTKVFLDEGLETNFVLATRNGYPPQLRKVSALPIQRGGYSPVPRGPYSPPVPPAPAPDYNNEPPYPNSYPGNASYIMVPQDVDALLQTVQRQSFDDNKLAIIREALREVSLPADDARRLITTIAFDRNRIELAKYMYTRVADRQNFYRVYDALQYQSSIREVQQYIDSYRP